MGSQLSSWVPVCPHGFQCLLAFSHSKFSLPSQPPILQTYSDPGPTTRPHNSVRSNPRNNSLTLHGSSWFCFPYWNLKNTIAETYNQHLVYQEVLSNRTGDPGTDVALLIFFIIFLTYFHCVCEHNRWSNSENPLLEIIHNTYNQALDSEQNFCKHILMGKKSFLSSPPPPSQMGKYLKHWSVYTILLVLWKF